MSPGAAGGVGGTSGTVGFYVDDISVEAPAAGDNGRIRIDSNVYDMNRVSVLRGPRHALINEQCSATGDVYPALARRYVRAFTGCRGGME